MKTNILLEIINEVKDFINKDTIKGCLVKETKFSRKKDRIIKNEIIHTIEGNVYYFDNQYTHKEKDIFVCLDYGKDPEFVASIYKLKIKDTNDSEFEILGNLNMSIIETYFHKIIGAYFVLTPNGYKKKIMIEDGMNPIFSIGDIPHKSLNRFTNDELKELLSLMKRAKNYYSYKKKN